MKLYRYERKMLLNEFEIKLCEYTVVKETCKGYWIIDSITLKKKFVLKGDNGKRYAYSTPEAALNAFIIRTSRCMAICKMALETAEGYLTTACKLAGVEVPKQKYKQYNNYEY